MPSTRDRSIRPDRAPRATGTRAIFLRLTACAVAVLAVSCSAAAGAALSASASTSQGGLRSGRQSAARDACARPRTAGRVACLAKFRSLPQAASAGVPAGLAASRRAGPASAAGSGVAAAATVQPPAVGYGPADVASMYGLNPTGGAGQTIAVVAAYDNPAAEADLATFRSAYSLPPCTTASGCLRRVNQRGGASMPAGKDAWGIEIDLDLQAASAVCPRCSLLYVGADSDLRTDIEASVDRAVALGAKIVSNSYAASEKDGMLAEAAAHYSHPGVAMIVSSGDQGFGGGATFPASWSGSIAVGGTSVTRARTGTGWTQSAWSGSGSGCSLYVDKPAWQRDAKCQKRTTSDVSALADPNTGFAIYDSYGSPSLGLPGWLVVGGTSLAAPLIAGMVGLAGNASALSNASHLYSHRSGLRDVIGGSNGDCGGDYRCTAVPGYDAPTGLGTPHGLTAL